MVSMCPAGDCYDWLGRWCEYRAWRSKTVKTEMRRHVDVGSWWVAGFKVNWVCEAAGSWWSHDQGPSFIVPGDLIVLLDWNGLDGLGDDNEWGGYSGKSSVDRSWYCMGDSDLASSMSLDENLTVGCGGCSAMGSALMLVWFQGIQWAMVWFLGFGVQRWSS